MEISIWDQTFYAWQLWRLQERVTAVGGDFFEALPAVDLYLLRYTLHDWDDVACIRILQNCRRAMLPGGYVAVIER